MSYFIVTRNHIDSKGTQHINRLSYSTDLNRAYRDLTTPNIYGCINCKYEDLNKAYRKTIDKDGRL